MTDKKQKIIGGNAKLVRNINRAAILNLIREKQPISRVDIARITKLNKSTVSSIVAELLENDYLIEELVPDSKVGRNPLQLRLNVSRFHVGAINFDTKIIRVALMNIGGAVVAKTECVPENNSPDEYVHKSLGLLSDLMKKLNITDLEGIGVTIAGLINPEDGHVLVAPNLGWKDIKLSELFLRSDPSIKLLRFYNDAKASALAELWYGEGPIKNYSNFVFVSVGAGLGTGVVINRKVVEGASHASGEFGHIPIYEQGIDCICGNSGCWEAYASDRATVKRYLALKKLAPNGDQPILVKDVIKAAQAGDKEAIQALRKTGEYLGIGISIIVRALDPQAIVIGGHILQAWDLIYDPILKGLEERSFFGLEKKTKILRSSLKERPRLIGAATLVIEHFFSDYKITLS